MTYKFECEKCGKISDIEMAMSDYDIPLLGGYTYSTRFLTNRQQ